MAITMQICGDILTCTVMMMMSIMYAWPSSTVKNFKSNETVLSHAMGPYEVALFGSLSSVGALVGTPLFGYLSDSIGRKYSCIAAGIPFLVHLMAANNRSLSTLVQMVVGVVLMICWPYTKPCSLLTILGMLLTWPSSTINNFKSNETVLSHVMESYEIALFGSLSSVGALVGTPLFGYLLDYIGRKYTCVAAGIPFLIGWSLIAAFNKVEIVLFAVFVGGIGSASGLITPVFASEICQDSLRGVMTIGTVIFYNVGVLFSYFLGGHLSYYNYVYVQLTLSATYILMASFLKDSPVYLMCKGLEKEAAESVAFYRSAKPDSKEVLEELNNIKKTMEQECEGIPETEKLNPAVQSTHKGNISPLKYLIKSQPSRRALVVCLIMITAANLMGTLVVMVYAEPLFREAVPNVAPTLCTTVLAVVVIAAAATSASLANKTGRKVTMVYSAGGSAVVTFLLATQLHLEWGPHILTAVFIYVFCFVYGIGAGAIPYILFCEVFVPEVKSFCSMLVIEWSCVSAFFVLLIFNPLVEMIGLGPVFYVFSVMCVCTAIFCYYFQPETKGLPVDEIQILFTDKKNRNNILV